jgi:hypothetical protein
VPGDLVVSPREDLAVVQWFDQEETGLEFITFSADGPSQVHHTGLPEIERVLSGYPEVGGVAMNTVYTTRPVFSPDGRYIVLAWQSGSIWWSSDRYYFDEHGILVAPPSPGGEYTIGTISILDWDERTHHAIPVVERVSPGWRPAPEKPAREGAIDDQPVFTDNEHFTLALPTGTARTFSVRP